MTYFMILLINYGLLPINYLINHVYTQGDEKL